MDRFTLLDARACKAAGGDNSFNSQLNDKATVAGRLVQDYVSLAAQPRLRYTALRRARWFRDQRNLQSRQAINRQQICRWYPHLNAKWLNSAAMMVSLVRSGRHCALAKIFLHQ
jgi:hypothetical protein